MSDPNQTPTVRSKGRLARAGQSLLDLYNPRTLREKGLIWSGFVALITYAVVVLALGVYWSIEPDTFDVREQAQARAGSAGDPLVSGYVTTATLLEVTGTLLDKPGGYLTNDHTPPGVYLDNIPNWEFGVLVQVRDMARALRNDFSRSQSQSVEDEDLAVAEPQFSFNADAWIFPATESEYRKGMEALERYLHRLADENQADAQFYSRADNLRDWLATVGKRLGSYSQRLSASVGQDRLNTDLAGEPDASQATPSPNEVRVKTSWFEIDDVFFEARGATWALIHFLEAVEVDFKDVLDKKNATVSLRQIVRELRATQRTVWSPLILNGSGFGMWANHSLVMASYISRANAALIDLRSLLEQG